MVVVVVMMVFVLRRCVLPGYDSCCVVDDDDHRGRRYDQLVIPAHVEKASDVLDTYSGGVQLKLAEMMDLRMGFERLIAARDAMQRALSLSYKPKVCPKFD